MNIILIIRLILPKSLTCLFIAVIYKYHWWDSSYRKWNRGFTGLSLLPSLCHCTSQPALVQICTDTNDSHKRFELLTFWLILGFLITNSHLSGSLFALPDDAHESVRMRICKALFFDYNHEAMMIQNYALIVDINIIIMSASMLSQDLCCCNSFWYFTYRDWLYDASPQCSLEASRPSR